jgi:hypothetical protein
MASEKTALPLAEFGAWRMRASWNTDDETREQSLNDRNPAAMWTRSPGHGRAATLGVFFNRARAPQPRTTARFPTDGRQPCAYNRPRSVRYVPHSQSRREGRLLQTSSQDIPPAVIHSHSLSHAPQFSAHQLAQKPLPPV